MQKDEINTGLLIIFNTLNNDFLARNEWHRLADKKVFTNITKDANKLLQNEKNSLLFCNHYVTLSVGHVMASVVHVCTFNFVDFFVR